MEINFLTNNLSLSQKNEFVSAKVEDVISVKDLDYIDFLKLFNGGFFFNQALHFYSIENTIKIFTLNEMNILLYSKYEKLSKGLTFFAQDIFGNQFAFEGKRIIFFNIETGDKEEIAQNFDEFINVVLQNSDYYIGEIYLSEWKSLNGDIKLNERLCPKIPFVLGGEYNIANLYALEIEKNIEYNAAIAVQVKDLPDGTAYKLEVK
jgi:SMI1 / KNR4 family (SUKH-1)